MQLDIIADQFRYFQHYHIVEVHRFDTLFKFSNKNSLKIGSKSSAKNWNHVLLPRPIYYASGTSSLAGFIAGQIKTYHRAAAAVAAAAAAAAYFAP